MLMGAAGTPVNVSAIVTSLCGTNPNYCTWQSGANKQNGLEAFLTEAVSTRYIPDPHSDQTAINVIEADAQTNCSTAAATPTSSSASALLNVTKAVGITSAFAPAAGAIASAAGGAAAGAALGTVVPVVGTIVGAIAGLIGGLIASGHAKAVAGEQEAICSAVPAANQALQQIDAGLSNGQLTPSQVPSLYSQLQANFTAALKQGTSYKAGDALWAYNLAMQGVIQARNQDLANGQLTGGGSIPSGAAAAIGAATGLPPWLPLVAAFGILYFLL